MSNFVVVCLIHFVVSKQAGSQAGFLHFSPRSRDQRKAHVLMYHHRLPSPAPSLATGTTGRYKMVRQLIYTRPETQDSCMVRMATFKVGTKDLIHHFQDVNVFRCF
jgi:hypothetical protein